MDFYILKEKPKKIIADFVYCRDTCGSDNLNILTVLNAFQEGIVNEIIVELKERFPIYEDTNLPGFFKTDYTFVMKNGKLILYKGGNKMCTVRKETAGNWISAFQNWEQLKIHYLYSPELLAFQEEKESEIYNILEKRFNSGSDLTEEDYLITEHYGLFLDDSHEADIWSRPGKPAYSKYLNMQDNLFVEFIIYKDSGKWGACMQLPYIRLQILGGFTSEKKAMKELREWISRNEEHLKDFAKTIKKYKKITDELQTGGPFIKSYNYYFEFLELNDPAKDWWLIDQAELKDSLKRIYDKAVTT